MFKNIIVIIFTFCVTTTNAQKPIDEYFITKKDNQTSSVKNQAVSGTCWCFASTSLVESNCMTKSNINTDISEMFTVRNIYIEKAKNYILCQGETQFSEGGQAHDMINAIEKYGAMPESIYNGLQNNETHYNHEELYAQLKNYLDSLIANMPIPDNWLDRYTQILENKIGTPPTKFEYKGKTFTPRKFADTYLKIKASDYITLTSFTHHPYYQSFILESPYNWANGLYYNIPLQKFMDITKDAIDKGYTVLWNGDVTNTGFVPAKSIAVNINYSKSISYYPDIQEQKWDATKRQRLYENLTTTVDHVMHIVGYGKTKNEKLFYKTKNSWGDIGPLKGFLYMSESYFATNTVSITLLKTAIDKKFSIFK